MKDIRKGNDIQYTWTVKNLEGVNGEKVVQLISCKTNVAQEAMTYSISGNVITGTFYGKDQKDVGAYRLLLLVNDGYDNMVTLDKVNAFNLTGVCNFGIVRGADDNAIETVVLEFESEIHVNVGASGEQVQADWDETNTDSPAYIRNKPTIPDVSNFIEKSQTAGLVKNDGTIDTTSYQSALASQTAYTSKGSATKVPQITTNALGQVTGITEVTITQPDVSNLIAKSNTAGLVKNDGTIDTNTYLTSQDISGKEDKMAIDSTAKTASFTAAVKNYYFVNIAASGSITVTLTTPSDNSSLQNAVFRVTTSTSPQLIFAAASGINVYKATNYKIEADKIYEVNAQWNGVNWDIANVELEAQS